MAEAQGHPALEISELHVYYGESHAIQGVSMTIAGGVLAVVGRNGMGKSTLCNAITGLKASRSGSIRIFGRETSRFEPHIIHRHRVGYVPQGRRVWPSLSVDEHLRLVATGGADAKWTVERVYQTFPRLYERRASGGSQLSGGEQQMLAIARALLCQPQMLLLDEPTEGLAPKIVDEVVDLLQRLRKDGLTAIVVDQRLETVFDTCDEAIVMGRGVPALRRNCQALKEQPDLLAEHLGV